MGLARACVKLRCTSAQVWESRPVCVSVCEFFHTQCDVAAGICYLVQRLASAQVFALQSFCVSAHSSFAGPVCPCLVSPLWTAAAAGAPGDTLLGYTGLGDIAWVHTW